MSGYRIVLLILLACLSVSQIATWVMLSRIKGDLDYERARSWHRGDDLSQPGYFPPRWPGEFEYVPPK
jgi:hypothetical protein